MPSGPYNLARQALLAGDVDLETATVRALLVRSSGYTEDLDADDSLTDIPAGARASSAVLASKTIALGVFDSADVTFAAVSAGECDRVVIYIDTGVEATSRLLHLFDTDAFGGDLPADPAGRNVVLTLPVTGWFQL